MVDFMGDRPDRIVKPVQGLIPRFESIAIVLLEDGDRRMIDGIMIFDLVDHPPGFDQAMVLLTRKDLFNAFESPVRGD